MIGRIASSYAFGTPTVVFPEGLVSTRRVDPISPLGFKAVMPQIGSVPVRRVLHLKSWEGDRWKAPRW